VRETRICRVAVDVLALERLFDYTVPAALADVVGVGTIVRVNLGGRRVRAWVVDDDVVSDAPPEKLRPLVAAVSAGPPPEIVDLTAWAAWRFAGPRLPLLRAASPPAVVPAGPAPWTAGPKPSAEVGVGTNARDGAAELAADAGRRPVAVVRWPPAADPAELVAGLIARTGSTIVVVPDGRLGSLAARLRQAGAATVPWLTEGRPRDRARAWDRGRRGGCVVLGGRSAVLAPVPDLGAVVILDDGAEALKEERSPTWHARDLAAERARRAGARLTLVSPVPPLEAPGPRLTPARTAERAGWPITEVIDRTKEPPGLGLFSPRAVAALRAVVQPGRRETGGCGGAEPPQARPAPPAGGDQRAICVLNRKGRARLLACAACAELARCERCEAAVAEADRDPAGAGVAVLACARCGSARPRVCVRCGSTKLKVLRAGVGRVREDLAALLPGVGVAMVDAATGDLPAEPVLIGTEAVLDRKSTRLNSSHNVISRMPSSA